MTTIDQSWYEKIAGVPESVSAGGVVVRRDGQEIFVALIHEIGDDFEEYVLPKGHIEIGESIDDAATREIAEETGITELKLLKKLAILERLSFDKKEWKIIHYFLFKTDQINVIPQDPDHQRDKTEWFKIDQLPEMFWPEQKELIEKNRDIIEKLS